MQIRRPRLTRIAPLLAIGAAVVLTSACGGGGGGGTGSSASGSGDQGGTYRVGWENSFGFTNSFDPTGEYLGEGMGIYSNLMIRTLSGYNHVAASAAIEFVPDLATDVPEPTDGGQTYTFKLRKGVKFGPPVNREVTSKDVLYAFERLPKPKNRGETAFFFNVIPAFS